MKTQMRPAWRDKWLMVLLMTTLSGCAGLGIPRESGLYAIQGGQMLRLDGDREWEKQTWGDRSSFDANVTFLIRSPQLAAAKDLSSRIYLRRVAWVRSEINQEGEIQPVDGNQWATTKIDELTVPIRIARDSENVEVVRVHPGVELDQGLYTLQFNSGSGRQVNARVGVQWPQVDRRAYAAANCVDHYPGSDVDYRLCADQRQVFASKWLKLHLVQPELRNIPGRQRELVVKGVVVNTSKHPRAVPMLEAQLVTDSGVVLERWEFTVPSKELQPGASIPFKSELPNPPPNASNVHVSFVSADPQPRNLVASP